MFTTRRRKAHAPDITRIEPGDPRVEAAVEAERQLFAHYGLGFKAHQVEMEDPNIRVRVLEVGAGEAVLMVPGGSGDAWQFAPLMAELRNRRLIVINRPGGGMSDGVDHRQVDLRHFAVKTLSTVLDAFGLERVPVIANSGGGLWAFWLALDAPDRVSIMVQLGCPALMLGTSAPFFMRLLSVPGVNRLLVRNLQPKSLETALDGLRFQGSRQQDIDAMPGVLRQAAYAFFQLPTYLETWLTFVSAVATIRGARRRYQLGADQLRRVEQAVQFIWGNRDPFGDLGVARQAASIMPRATLHEIGAGHLPHLDKPAECAYLIGEFLASAAPHRAGEVPARSYSPAAQPPS